MFTGLPSGLYAGVAVLSPHPCNVGSWSLSLKDDQDDADACCDDGDEEEEE